MRVAVADDLMLTREGIVRLLRDAEIDVVAEAGDAESLLRDIAITVPDVAIVDIRMPPTHTDEGRQAAREIRTKYPTVGVLLLPEYVEPTYAMRHGGSVGSWIAGMLAEHDRAEELLDDLRQLTNGYEPPSDGCVSYAACYAGRAELEADTHLHRHKENNLLFPAVVRLGRATPGRSVVTGPLDEGGGPACWADLLEEKRSDITSRGDVRQLVVDFYRDVAMDDVLGPIFAAADVNWSMHIPKLTDF
jgi:DNA-binding NarL/FixJ family response regulator